MTSEERIKKTDEAIDVLEEIWGYSTNLTELEEDRLNGAINVLRQLKLTFKRV